MPRAPRPGCSGTRARVEARAALEQAEELRRVMEDLRKWFSEWEQEGEGREPNRVTFSLWIHRSPLMWTPYDTSVGG
jgi:hypothetical protein